MICSLQLKNNGNKPSKGQKNSCVNRRHNTRDKDLVWQENNKDPGKIQVNGWYENWLDMDVKDKYTELFDTAIKEYNSKQRRKDRKIKDYFKKIEEEDKQKHSCYEIIVKLGAMEDKIDPKKVYPALKKYFETFEERNPNLKVFGCYFHADERGAPHIHLDYIPIGHNRHNKPSKLSVFTSLTQGLGEMGFVTSAGNSTAQIQWEERERLAMTKICREFDIEITKAPPERQFKGKDKEQFLMNKEMAKEAEENNRRAWKNKDIAEKSVIQAQAQQQANNIKQKELNNREKEQNDKQKELDDKEKKLDDKQKEQDDLEISLKKRLEAITTRESELNELKTNVVQFRDILKDNQKKLNKQENDQNDKEKELSEREVKISEREVKQNKRDELTAMYSKDLVQNQREIEGCLTLSKELSLNDTMYEYAKVPITYKEFNIRRKKILDVFIGMKGFIVNLLQKIDILQKSLNEWINASPETLKNNANILLKNNCNSWKEYKEKQQQKQEQEKRKTIIDTSNIFHPKPQTTSQQQNKPRRNRNHDDWDYSR